MDLTHPSVHTRLPVCPEDVLHLSLHGGGRVMVTWEQRFVDGLVLVQCMFPAEIPGDEWSCDLRDLSWLSLPVGCLCGIFQSAAIS